MNESLAALELLSVSLCVYIYIYLRVSKPTQEGQLYSKTACKCCKVGLQVSYSHFKKKNTTEVVHLCLSVSPLQMVLLHIGSLIPPGEVVPGLAAVVLLVDMVL